MRFLEQWLWLAGKQAGVTNTTAETTLLGTGLKAGSLTIPANTLREGASIHIMAAGRITDTGSTLWPVVRFKMGSNVQASCTVGFLSQTTQPWKLDILWTLTSLASNQAQCAIRSTNLTGTTIGGGLDSTFDETAANAMDLTAQFGSADATIAFYIDHARCTLINP